MLQVRPRWKPTCHSAFSVLIRIIISNPFPSPVAVSPYRLIREEAQRMGSHGAGSDDDIAVPFGRIQEISAKYNLTVQTMTCGEGGM